MVELSEHTRGERARRALLGGASWIFISFLRQRFVTFVKNEKTQCTLLVFAGGARISWNAGDALLVVRQWNYYYYYYLKGIFRTNETHERSFVTLAAALLTFVLPDCFSFDVLLVERSDFFIFAHTL